MRNHQNSRKDGNLRGLITIIIVFLNTGFALTVGRETEMIFVNVGYILIDAWVYGKKVMILKNFRTWVMGVIFMALTFINHLDVGAIFEYLRVTIIMFCACYITSVFSFDELVDGFCKYMRFVAVVSCLFYFAFRLFPTFPFPTATNAVGVEYYTCLIGNINVFTVETGFVRNSGLFWEGGMYAALAALWLICEIEYQKHERHFWMIVVLGLIVILTTGSTTGYLYMVLLLFLLIVHNSTGKRSIAQSLLLFAGFCTAIVIGTQYEAIIDTLAGYNKNVFGKLVTQNKSFTDRINGPVSDLWLSMTNLLGVGLLDLQNRASQTAQDLFGIRLSTRTSTLTYFFAAFGPMCGIWTNCQWGRTIKNTIDSKLEALFVSGMFLILATSTPLQYTFVFWIIIFLGDMNRQKEEVLLE